MPSPFKAPLLAAALLASVAGGALAQPGPDGGPPAMAAGAMFRATTLSLSAYGEVKAAPDLAVISLGVQTLGPTAAEAMSKNAAEMNRVVQALKRAGIADKDIQTSGLNLNAQYAYEQNQPPRLTGYQASNQLTITVYDLARLGASLDAVVAAGANQVNGVSFGLKDPQGAEDAARLQAVHALQAKAQLYAGATGLHLARLINLSEGVNIAQPPGQITLTAARKMEAYAPSTPVQGGELDVRVDISGLYELEK